MIFGQSRLLFQRLSNEKIHRNPSVTQVILLHTNRDGYANRTDNITSSLVRGQHSEGRMFRCVAHRRNFDLLRCIALSKLCKLNRSASFSANATPRTLLPIRSRGGDHIASPIMFGTTRTISPDTADLAGSPTLKANEPE